MKFKCLNFKVYSLGAMECLQLYLKSGKFGLNHVSTFLITLIQDNYPILADCSTFNKLRCMQRLFKLHRSLSCNSVDLLKICIFIFSKVQIITIFESADSENIKSIEFVHKAMSNGST